MDVVYQVWSDNFNGEFLTPEAFDFVLMSMSTGDYALHRSTKFLIEDLKGEQSVVCLDEVHKELCTVSICYTKNNNLRETNNYV
jgi:hypothetical protein